MRATVSQTIKWTEFRCNIHYSPPGIRLAAKRSRRKKNADIQQNDPKISNTQMRAHMHRGIFHAQAILFDYIETAIRAQHTNNSYLFCEWMQLNLPILDRNVRQQCSTATQCNQTAHSVVHTYCVTYVRYFANGWMEKPICLNGIESPNVRFIPQTQCCAIEQWPSHISITYEL